MSFSSDFCLHKPRSTEIKEDFLVSFHDLGLLEKTLKKSNVGNVNVDDAKEKLENIVSVYNENITYISKESRRTFPEFPNLEEYKKTRACTRFGESEKDILEEYTHQKTLFEFRQRKEWCEVAQLTEITYLCKTLREKITNCYTKLQIIDDQVASCVLLKIEDEHCALFAPRLRLASPPKAKTSTGLIIEKAVSAPVVNVPTTQVVDTPVVVETEPKTVSNDPQITITVTTDLPSEYTFGICCAPEWDKAPIAFVKEGQGWSGQLPLCKNWKCVALQNGQVVKWEGYWGDRHCDAQTQPFNLHVDFS